ncbi:TetR family transcriptional regulator [Streptomyces tateyamensis]|uniref:TetR family transcriptional regulator n=1 Tax=Streptomyces tateyamensis TaxID=565073 RepID=A0A2V4NZA3_9ACTN|nr:TetR/AcrR family transcriptional regulator [Streptomyces tateyamensis]PYC77194.1 TetR family transcriptional regulator [Streptomyces tateyamensis]
MPANEPSSATPTTSASPRGAAARAQVLAAAAELFTRDGYAATTTRAVAERAGLRQGTLYHHFAAKEDILATLLEATVAPSLAYARRLLEPAEPVPGARLWALVRFDTELLLGGLSNVGALYQLPEVRGERFAEFRQVRCDLAGAYRTVLAPLDELPEDQLRLRAQLVLGLVEGAVAVARECAEQEAAVVPAAVADAAVRLASPQGCTEERLAAVREAALELAVLAGR